MLSMSGVEDTGATGPDEKPDDSLRIGVMRGAGVQVDAGRVGYVAAVMALTIVMVIAAVLVVAGLRKNSQIDNLRANGVPVEMTVTRCLALVGGTGSSPAGFECTGTYRYQGHRYIEGIPGSQNLPVGSTVHGVAASDDPALFSTPETVASEQASSARVVLPAALFVIALAACIWIVVRRRHRITGG